jgi:lipopolysaccharide biosynthesis glycosyltransferase
MLTEDLYDKYHRLLETVYDVVFKVPYITHNCGRLRTFKIESIYGEWKNVSFTKWYCLSLSQYSKVCFLDADLIITQNIDNLFNVKTPAGCFHNHWVDFGHIKSVNYYNGTNFGDELKKSAVQSGLTNGYVLIANCVVLEPSDKLYDGFLKYMESDYKDYPNCISMVDEKAITSYMIQSDQVWHQLDYSFNSIPWHMNKSHIQFDIPSQTFVFKQPLIIHYFNKEKPWITNRGKWNDTEIWWQYYVDLKKNNSLSDYKKLLEPLEKFNINPVSECPYCILINELYNIHDMCYINPRHNMIVNGQISCVSLIKHRRDQVLA